MRTAFSRLTLLTILVALLHFDLRWCADQCSNHQAGGRGCRWACPSPVLFGAAMSADSSAVEQFAPQFGWLRLEPSKAFGDDATLFVNVPSFRDVFCVITVRELYSKSKNPRRIFVGVMQQHVEEASCIPQEYLVCDPLSFCPKDNIRVRKWPPSKARGSTFGRFVAGLMYRAEKYYMMIDSHNVFVQDWDRLSITMFMHIPGDRKVMSHYPNHYEERKQLIFFQIMVMCFLQWIGDFGIMKNQIEAMRVMGHGRLQPFSATAFLFADAETMHRVPLDPYLDYLVDGEDTLFGVRLWTHGYDLYCPASPILFHSYDRPLARRFWHEKGNKWQERQMVSQLRLKRIMKLVYPNTTELMVPLDVDVPPRVVREIAKYGLGKERTIEQYWAFAMIDPVSRTSGHEFCDKLSG